MLARRSRDPLGLGHVTHKVHNVFDKRVAQTSEWPTFSATRHHHAQQLFSLLSKMPSTSNEAKIILALQALEKDEKLSVRAAAKIYGVARKTLGRRRAGTPARRDIPANSRNLTDLEEQTIVQYVVELYTRAFPPRLGGVEDMAN